jgi:hypothetical protein
LKCIVSPNESADFQTHCKAHDSFFDADRPAFKATLTATYESTHETTIWSTIEATHSAANW